MIFVLVAHLTLATHDASIVVGSHAFMRQDACEAYKAQLVQADMQDGQPVLDLECKQMGVVE